MIVSAVCPSFAKRLLYYDHDPFAVTVDHELKAELVGRALDKGAELVVGTECFLGYDSILPFTRLIEEQHGAFSLISGALCTDPALGRSNKLIAYTGGEISMDRIKNAESMFDTWNYLIVGSEGSSDYPTLAFDGYTVLPLLCCELHSIREKIIELDEPVDIITVSCINMYTLDNSLKKFVYSEGCRVSVNKEIVLAAVKDFEHDGYLKPGGSLLISDLVEINGTVPITLLAQADKVRVGNECLVGQV